MRDNGDYYTGHSGEAYQRAVHGDVLESDVVFRAKAKLAAFRYFRELPADARVFEFGVGVGTNLAALPHGTKHGYDIGEFARRKAAEAGIEVFPTLDSIPRSAYDLVVCRHVLEHVADPLGLLQDLRTLLTPSGQLLLIIPVESTKTLQRVLPDVDTNNHLYAWGPQHIVNLLNAASLVPVTHRHHWYSLQAKLAPTLNLLGVSIYSALVTIAGHLRRQRELAIWARQV